MIPGSPFEDYSDVIGCLLVRVYEIHQRVLAKGGGGFLGLGMPARTWILQTPKRRHSPFAVEASPGLA